MSRELLQMVFNAMSYGNAQDRESARLAVGVALAEQPAQPAQQEPELFERWYDKQYGNAEEIGFQQALRIAYAAGQDSVTTPQAQRKPLNVAEVEQIVGHFSYEIHGRARYIVRMTEAAHGIKEKNT